MIATNETPTLTKQQKTNKCYQHYQRNPASLKEYATLIINAHLTLLPKYIALIGNSVSTQHLQLLIDVNKTKHCIQNLEPGAIKFLFFLMAFNFKPNSIIVI